MKIRAPETFTTKDSRLLCVVNCTQCGFKTSVESPALNTCPDCKIILNLPEVFNLCPKCKPTTIENKTSHNDKHLTQLMVADSPWWEQPFE